MNTITERMRQVMESRGLNAKTFAGKLGIERSGLSHIYSGRNKPGLELIVKVLDTFPDISADWLLTGKGEMSLSSSNTVIRDEPDQPIPEREPHAEEVTSVTTSDNESSVYSSNTTRPDTATAEVTRESETATASARITPGDGSCPLSADINDIDSTDVGIDSMDSLIREDPLPHSPQIQKSVETLILLNDDGTFKMFRKE